MSKRIITNEEISMFLQMYEQGFSLRKIQNILKIPRGRLSAILKDSSIPIKMKYPRRKYPADEDFFNNIDTQEKAYFMGLFASDGANLVSKKGKSIQIGLQDQDVSVLQKLNDLIQPSREVRFKPRAKTHYKDIRILTIDSSKISDRMTELGCPPRKTFLLTWPNWISEELIPHYVRGYFDGDGHCSTVASFCTNIEFGNSLKNVIENYTKCKVSLCYDKRAPRNLTVRLSGRNNILKFLDWIYNESNIHLKRKYNKYLELKFKEPSLYEDLYHENGLKLTKEEKRIYFPKIYEEYFMNEQKYYAQDFT